MTTKLNTGWKAYALKVTKSEGQWCAWIARVETGKIIFTTVGKNKCDAHRKLDKQLKVIRRLDRNTNSKNASIDAKVVTHYGNGETSETEQELVFEEVENVSTVAQTICNSLHFNKKGVMTPCSSIRTAFDALYKEIENGEVTRAMFVEACVDNKIDKGTASTQFGRNRTAQIKASK